MFACEEPVQTWDWSPGLGGLAVVNFYRATACNGMHSIAVTILSVCLSDSCIVTKLNDGLRVFWYHTKRQSLVFWATPRSHWNLHSKWPSLFENADFDRFPLITHNVSTVRDSEKKLITANIKSTVGFPTSYRCSAYVSPKSRKGGWKSIFSFLGIKVNFSGIK